MGSSHGLTPNDDDADEVVLRNALGKRLRLRRKERGITMVALGRIAHCSQSFLSKVENGSIIPSIPMLYRLASALDVRPSLLLGETPQDRGSQADAGPAAERQDP